MSRHSGKKVRNQRPTKSVYGNEGVQNVASTLLTNIRFSAVDNEIKSIAVTSAGANEGKTSTALALALAIGAGGQRCLLVEGDMRRRSMRSALGAKSRMGIYSVLAGQCRVEDAVVPTQFPGVMFLDAEQGIPNPVSIVSSRHFAELIDKLCETYDYVVIDTPPVAAFADASVIASVADGTLLVVREGFTNRRNLVYAAEQLDASDANVLGVVLNCQSAKSGDYGYYYNYHYYYDEERVPKSRLREPGQTQQMPRITSEDVAESPMAASSQPAAHAASHGRGGAPSSNPTPRGGRHGKHSR